MKTAECRSCGEPVIWTTTSKGKRMPVDAEPSSEGTFDLQEDGDTVNAAWAPKGSSPDLHLSHFSTCPQSKEWRKS